MEGDYEMKPFFAGFVNGIKSCTLICVVITGGMGALYCSIKGLEYLVETYGEYVVAACSVIGLIILFGVFEGFWTRHQYNKWVKRLERLKTQKDTMTCWEYEYEVDRIKSAMKDILNHNYSRLVR